MVRAAPHHSRRAGSFMKKIEATIRPSDLDEVKGALTEIGVTGMTVSEIFSLLKPRPGVYRGIPYGIDQTPRLKLEIVTVESMVAAVVDALDSYAGSSELGKPGLVVTEIIEVRRIRTGEYNEYAV